MNCTEKEKNKANSLRGALAILAIAGLHWSTILFPISISYPHRALDMTTGGRIAIEPLSHWGTLVTLVLLLTNILCLVAIFRLLKVWNFRARWFYIFALGTTITMFFSLLAGALWNVLIMFAMWRAFLRRTKEFFQPKTLLPIKT